MNNSTYTNHLDDEIIYSEEDIDESSLEQEDSSVNIPLNGGSLYPRIYMGDSVEPLSGQFNESEYIDDNISRTWTGLLTDIYG